MDYVLSILQGQVESLTQLRYQGTHDDGFSISQVLRNAILESAHVAEHLCLLRKKEFCEKLSVKTDAKRKNRRVNSVKETVQSDEHYDIKMKTEVEELYKVMRFVRQMRTSQTDSEWRSHGLIQYENNLIEPIKVLWKQRQVNRLSTVIEIPVI